MNAERLLQHFERISEAPDAIPRLRRFILDLAVRGKLVEQDPNDEPASELLRRIQTEKARWAKEGKIRQAKALPRIPEDQQPFFLPDNWVWSRLGEVITLLSGQHLQPNEYSENDQSGPPYVTGPADFGVAGLTISRYALVRKAVATKGQLLLTVKGAGVGKTATCDIPEVAISRQLMALTAIQWSQRFLVLTTHMLAETLKEKARSLIPGISRDDVELFVFGLPPLAEQHRIVAKVDELMALCDQLEAAKTEREQSRDRLVAASLHRLNSPADTVETAASDLPARQTDAFRDHARFIFNHLPCLTTRPEHIKQLRQTILNLVVRGNLVPQDPNDEPAAELLKRLAQSKQQKGMQSRKGAKLQQLNDENGEMPFQIPSNWLWLRIGTLFEVAGGIQKTPLRAPKSNAFPYLGVGNVYRGRIDLTTVKEFELQDGELERWHLEVGDLLIIEGNGSLSEIGRCAIWNGEIESCVHQNHVIRCRPLDLQISPFVLQFLNSPAGTAIMQRLAITTSGLYSLSVGKIRQIEVPLPPLAEQHRIVTRVDELMALCDQLEAQLTSTEADSRRLLEAVLHEALAPAPEETA